MRSILISFITIMIIVGCTPPATAPVAEITDPYMSEIQDWHQQRNARLNQPDSWLTLSGLFWLEQGENTFGGSLENDLVFPGHQVAARLGTFILKGDSVSLRIHDGINIMTNDSTLTETGLKKDSSGEPDILQWGSLTWYIIERGDRIGVRLKDAAHPNYVNFKPTELFPIKPDLRVQATLLPFDTTTTIEIVNVLGDASPNPTPGILSFELDGKMHSLTPLGDEGDENYFIIFGDASNGLTTYGAGRFLVVPAVNAEGVTTIDFNRAYNMPCVFSPFATCPLPPSENILSIAIEAGEKDYHIPGGH